MREIKFRYIFKNEIFNDISIYYLTLEEIENGKLNQILKSGMIENGYKIITRNLFTNCKDINHQDIYENDIVKYSDICSDEYMINAKQVIGVIKWVDSRCSLNPQQAEENTRGGHYITLWSNIIEIEVIGNIYENINLLDEIKNG